jgi:hypothetical protein
MICKSGAQINSWIEILNFEVVFYLTVKKGLL